MFNSQKTQELCNQEKYIHFIKWCKENGALISDEVQYPSAFGAQGYTGISAKMNIAANKVIIAIPNKLIISHHKVLKSELSDMFKAHKPFFDDQITADAEFNCLALYIFYHKLQGEKSFWYPYLNVVEQHTMFEWRNRDLFNLQDQSLIDEFMYIQSEMDKSWYKFKGVMNKYPQYYGCLTEEHKDMFYWSNEFVMTRCFGWTLPSTSLVPMADMLNHSNINPATYHLVNRLIEQNGQPNNRYTLKRERIDLKLLELDFKIDPKYQIRNTQEAYIQTNKQLLVHEFEGQTTRDKINQINYNVLKLWKEKQAWELDFESSSQSEDNDTDSEDEDKIDKLTQIRQKELKIIQEKNTKLDQKYTQKCQDIITSIIPKNTQYKQTQSTIQIKGKRTFEEDLEKDQNSSESSDDSEKDFDWYNDDDDQVYFCITTAGQIQQGEQIYTFYGRRNNRFLLLWYGFTMNNNKYNSFNLRLWLNPEPMPMNDQIYSKIIVTDIVNLNHLKYGQINGVPINQLSKEIKLKGSKLQEDLIIYVRLFLMAYYIGQDANSILLTIPVSIDFEIQVFDFTLKLLSYLAQKFKSPYQEDLNLNLNNLKCEEYFALNYRIGQKELILLQINHIMEALKLLRMLKQQPKLNIKEYFMQQSNSVEKMRALRYYIKYL
ncbi:unnamed protein product [Paramecium primaurelia]|uniref:SET domain-containing protein n=1 Tax=Paramecium primaurelia TaxID=5886 RepID=A0A8S1LQP8_PARPR|nr:unnamed protein product [Paramecium primaurelia]